MRVIWSAKTALCQGNRHATRWYTQLKTHGNRLLGDLRTRLSQCDKGLCLLLYALVPRLLSRDRNESFLRRVATAQRKDGRFAYRERPAENEDIRRAYRNLNRKRNNDEWTFYLAHCLPLCRCLRHCAASACFRIEATTFGEMPPYRMFSYTAAVLSFRLSVCSIAVRSCKSQTAFE